MGLPARLLRVARDRLRGLFRRTAVTDEISEEIQFHLDERTSEHERSGLSRPAARSAALARFGNPAVIRDRGHDVRGGGLMESVLQDVRYGVRLLLKQRGFSIVAIVTLALGIGATSAVFSALDAVLLRPLPYQDPGKLVMVWEEALRLGAPKWRPSPGNFHDWQDQNHSFTAMAATTNEAATLVGDGAPEQVPGRRVSWNLFAILGVPPYLGRTFSEEEQRAGVRCVVLSYSLWQRRFGGDPGVVGRKIRMDDLANEVIGVMPKDFAFPDRRVGIWQPLALPPDVATRRNSHFLNVFARLKPDVSLEQAQQDLLAVARRLESQFPATNTKIGAVVLPLKTELLGDTRTSLVVLVAASACVLLVACANVANLLLTRAWQRRREVSIRIALGATRARLIRQVLTESTLMAVIAGGVGLAVALVVIKALAMLVPATFVGATSFGLDPRVLAFTAAVSVLTGVVFGLAPALQSGSARVQNVLKQTGRSSAGRHGWIRDLFVVTEVALALVLLVGASLLVETLVGLKNVDAGFDARGVLTAEAYVPFPKYNDQPKRDQFYRQVIEHLRAVSGVVSAGLTSDIPFTSRGNTMSFAAEGKVATPSSTQDALFRLVSSDYFRTMGIPMKRGRSFLESDDEGGLPVAIINEAMARDVWPGEDPVGRRVQVTTVWYTIVGVVRDVRERGLDYALRDAIYLPFPQFEPSFFVPSRMAIRTTLATPELMTKSLQAAVWEVDPDQPITSIASMDSIVDGEVANRTQVLRFLGALAALAITLAAIGIHGVLSYSVVQERTAIGIRLALGARPVSVVAHVVVHGLRMAGTGLVIGAVIALGATRLLSSFLFGVSATDPRVFAGVAAGLLAVSLMACFLPAWRAANVDPVIALRSE